MKQDVSGLQKQLQKYMLISIHIMNAYIVHNDTAAGNPSGHEVWYRLLEGRGRTDLPDR